MRKEGCRGLSEAHVTSWLQHRDLQPSLQRGCEESQGLNKTQTLWRENEIRKPEHQDDGVTGPAQGSHFPL